MKKIFLASLFSVMFFGVGFHITFAYGDCNGGFNSNGEPCTDTTPASNITNRTSTVGAGGSTGSIGGASAGSIGTGASNGSVGSGASTGSVGGGSSDSSVMSSIPNPLKGVNSISELIYKVVDVIVGISYIVVAFFLLLSGFKFVTAQGSDTKLSEAKNTFFYTIIGAALVIGAKVIVSVLENVFNGLNK